MVKPNFYYFAVYDGHGTQGKEASQAVNDYISTYIQERTKRINKMSKTTSNKKMYKLFKEAFNSTDKRLNKSVRIHWVFK